MRTALPNPAALLGIGVLGLIGSYSQAEGPKVDPVFYYPGPVLKLDPRQRAEIWYHAEERLNSKGAIVERCVFPQLRIGNVSEWTTSFTLRLVEKSARNTRVVGSANVIAPIPAGFRGDLALMPKHCAPGAADLYLETTFDKQSVRVKFQSAPLTPSTK